MASPLPTDVGTLPPGFTSLIMVWWLRTTDALVEGRRLLSFINLGAGPIVAVTLLVPVETGSHAEGYLVHAGGRVAVRPGEVVPLAHALLDCTEDPVTSLTE